MSSLQHALAWLLLILATACHSKAVPEPGVEPRPAEVKELRAKPPGKTLSSTSSKKSRPMIDDPPASAWQYSGEEDFAGLKIHFRGAPLEQADSIFVLFHGYGAPGDDLVPLSQVIDAGSSTALLFPEAPVALPIGGRAWFRRDRSNFDMGVKRAQALFASISKKYPQLPLLVGGFSQGAMLTANLVEHAGRELKAAVLLSSTDLLLSPLEGQAKGTPLFLSHGQIDPVLPFAGSESLRDRFISHGYSVTWVPFMGQHAIPPVVIAELNRFLSALPGEKP